jgi:hypothetical protein
MDVKRLFSKQIVSFFILLSRFNAGELKELESFYFNKYNRKFNRIVLTYMYNYTHIILKACLYCACKLSSKPRQGLFTRAWFAGLACLNGAPGFICDNRASLFSLDAT